MFTPRNSVAPRFLPSVTAVLAILTLAGAGTSAHLFRQCRQLERGRGPWLERQKDRAVLHVGPLSCPVEVAYPNLAELHRFWRWEDRFPGYLFAEISTTWGGTKYAMEGTELFVFDVANGRLRERLRFEFSGYDFKPDGTWMSSSGCWFSTSPSGALLVTHESTGRTWELTPDGQRRLVDVTR